MCMGDYPLALSGSVVNATGGSWSGGAGSYTGFGLNAGYTPSALRMTAGAVTSPSPPRGIPDAGPDNDVVHIVLWNSFLNANISHTDALCAPVATVARPPSAPACHRSATSGCRAGKPGPRR